MVRGAWCVVRGATMADRALEREYPRLHLPFYDPMIEF